MCDWHYSNKKDSQENIKWFGRNKKNYLHGCQRIFNESSKQYLQSWSLFKRMYKQTYYPTTHPPPQKKKCTY